MIPFWTEIVELMTAAVMLLAAAEVLKKTADAQYNGICATYRAEDR
ncbi:hypothetical protein M3P21_10615 [Ruegeria sp. 2012CJ41-6]|uniref:Uncharacterized protein n=1 Tax=Ruegeria spongiae TaxID=2942209 RepID=A0ABT0Q2F4_9RHOB|nr:hypothetical protein [Ruegeria spongiae]MCL6283983.1 hypothetical protein [Ruegeria spongiae]